MGALVAHTSTKVDTSSRKASIHKSEAVAWIFKIAGDKVERSVKGLVNNKEVPKGKFMLPLMKFYD